LALSAAKVNYTRQNKLNKTGRKSWEIEDGRKTDGDKSKTLLQLTCVPLMLIELKSIGKLLSARSLALRNKRETQLDGKDIARRKKCGVVPEIFIIK